MNLHLVQQMTDLGVGVTTLSMSTCKRSGCVSVHFLILANNQIDALFIYLFHLSTCFERQCSSSGDRIVLIHNLVSFV